uniref:Uncharacterized protein n=1 Tax=Romanomermis culicivorax TaxID=13658 RepID=A0A915JNZ8_ROMCU
MFESNLKFAFIADHGNVCLGYDGCGICSLDPHDVKYTSTNDDYDTSGFYDFRNDRINAYYVKCTCFGNDQCNISVVHA